MSESTETPVIEKGNIRKFQGKEYDITDPRFVGQSKNAIKRILRDEIWEESRQERTKIKRDKQKRKRDERKQLVEEGVLEPLEKKPRAKHMSVGNVGAILDCGFSSYMNPKELDSLRQQIVRCYAANVRAKTNGMQMAMTSLDKPMMDIMDNKKVLWRSWRHFQAFEEPFSDKFNKENLVYLSADSDNVITELEEGKTYIIGAIVDKNRHKNLCKDKAEKLGIKTGQLPIGNYIQMASRKVLTVNQVFEIMVKWLDTRDWEKAFMDVIPGRKLKESTLLKEGEDGNQDDDDEEEEEEDDDDKEDDKEDQSEDQAKESDD